jgi:hypothetical protein
MRADHAHRGESGVTRQVADPIERGRAREHRLSLSPARSAYRWFHVHAEDSAATIHFSQKARHPLGRARLPGQHGVRALFGRIGQLEQFTVAARPQIRYAGRERQ